VAIFFRKKVPKKLSTNSSTSSAECRIRNNQRDTDTSNEV
jgi:hypothetical protein